MAVSVVKRPLGIIKGSTSYTGSTFNSGGTLLITNNLHGLSDGDYIYVKSSIDSYNGFWYVDVINVNNFTLREYATADQVAYIASTTDFTYYVDPTIITNKWSCVHLPIVYKISNTLWPTNSADTERTISSVTDSNGYCQLSISGDIKTSGNAQYLEFVKITNADQSIYVDDLSGIWQIISYTNDTSFVIDIPYSTSFDDQLTGATIQYYYNNYHVNVQVWGGLNNGHTYYAQKPYELISTLELIPDSNNLCVFSISDILMNHIKVTNNLLIGTFPNNLDAWTGFFIKISDSYDYNNSGELGTYTSDYVSDLANFEGYAVNSMLPFKSVSSGFMSDYVMSYDTAKFLTLLDPLVYFSDLAYQDISFILPTSNVAVKAKIEYYLDNTLSYSEYIAITSADEGVYRFEFPSISNDYSYIKLSIHVDSTDEQISEQLTIIVQ